MPNLGNKYIGKLYEKRGDDYFIVNTSTNGEVVEIVQRDSIRLMYPSINFWAESAPRMIELVQKAAGIKADEPEYEYAVKRTSPTGNSEWVIGDYWGDYEDRSSALADFKELNRGGLRYWLVRRRKAGPVEDVV